ncbi:MAG: type transport system permease protein [Gaiellaceae bacterium]|jgi:ABC-type transport system involved in multi-copper enzyme maturation permease subunit|nr:type transport system permease protein [Gaiellaceae bacterium]
MSTVAIPGTEFRGKVTQARVILSEWTKLRSVRSTRWSLLAATVLTIGFPILAAAVISSHWGHQSAEERASFNPLDPALIGSQIAQLAIGILGVLVISAEYSTGMIRATFTAVPKRLPVLWAKAIVFAVVTFLLMLPSVVIAFFASQSILSRHHVNIAWSHPGVARAVIGAALYLTVIAVMTLGIGTILRNTAGGIATFAAIFFVIPPLMNVLPTSWNDAITPYLPSNAGRAIISITHDVHSLAPWTGFALFCGYAALALAVAAVLLVRRDT